MSARQHTEYASPKGATADWQSVVELHVALGEIGVEAAQVFRSVGAALAGRREEKLVAIWDHAVKSFSLENGSLNRFADPLERDKELVHRLIDALSNHDAVMIRDWTARPATVEPSGSVEARTSRLGAESLFTKTAHITNASEFAEISTELANSIERKYKTNFVPSERELSPEARAGVAADDLLQKQFPRRVFVAPGSVARDWQSVVDQQRDSGLLDPAMHAVCEKIGFLLGERSPAKLREVWKSFFDTFIRDASELPEGTERSARQTCALIDGLSNAGAIKIRFAEQSYKKAKSISADELDDAGAETLKALQNALLEAVTERLTTRTKRTQSTLGVEQEVAKEIRLLDQPSSDKDAPKPTMQLTPMHAVGTAQPSEQSFDVAALVASVDLEPLQRSGDVLGQRRIEAAPILKSESTADPVAKNFVADATAPVIFAAPFEPFRHIVDEHPREEPIHFHQSILDAAVAEAEARQDVIIAPDAPVVDECADQDVYEAKSNISNLDPLTIQVASTYAEVVNPDAPIQGTQSANVVTEARPVSVRRAVTNDQQLVLHDSVPVPNATNVTPQRPPSEAFVQETLRASSDQVLNRWMLQDHDKSTDWVSFGRKIYDALAPCSMRLMRTTSGTLMIDWVIQSEHGQRRCMFSLGDNRTPQDVLQIAAGANELWNQAQVDRNPLTSDVFRGLLAAGVLPVRIDKMNLDDTSFVLKGLSRGAAFVNTIFNDCTVCISGTPNSEVQFRNVRFNNCRVIIDAPATKETRTSLEACFFDRRSTLAGDLRGARIDSATEIHCDATAMNLLGVEWRIKGKQHDLSKRLNGALFSEGLIDKAALLAMGDAYEVSNAQKVKRDRASNSNFGGSDARRDLRVAGVELRKVSVSNAHALPANVRKALRSASLVSHEGDESETRVLTLFPATSWITRVQSWLPGFLRSATPPSYLIPVEANSGTLSQSNRGVARTFSTVAGAMLELVQAVDFQTAIVPQWSKPAPGHAFSGVTLNGIILPASDDRSERVLQIGKRFFGQKFTDSKAFRTHPDTIAAVEHLRRSVGW